MQANMPEQNADKREFIVFTSERNERIIDKLLFFFKKNHGHLQTKNANDPLSGLKGSLIAKRWIGRQTL